MAFFNLQKIQLNFWTILFNKKIFFDGFFVIPKNSSTKIIVPLKKFSRVLKPAEKRTKMPTFIKIKNCFFKKWPLK